MTTTNNQEIPHHSIRYYNCPPDKMTLEKAAAHGANHRAYGWSLKLDPRWSQEQREAYITAWNKGEDGSATRM